MQPEVVPASDPLARADGVTNALVCLASPVGEVAITGPGAGPQLAGQGVLSDIIAVADGRQETSKRLPQPQDACPEGCITAT